MKCYGGARENLSADKWRPKRNRRIRLFRLISGLTGVLCVVLTADASRDTLRILLQFEPPYMVMPSPEGDLAAESSRHIFILSNKETVETEWKVEETAHSAPARRVADIALGSENTLFLEQDSKSASFSQRVAGRDQERYIIQIRVGSKYGIPESSNEWVSRGVLTVKGENLSRLRKDRLNSLLAGSETPVQTQRESEPKTRSFSGPPRGLKMWIGAEGMVEITRSEIEAAGWKGVRNVDPRFLQIIGTQGEVPLYFTGESSRRFGASDRILFWADAAWETASSGHKRKDIFSSQNVYWLRLGDRHGMRLAREDGGLPSSSMKNVIHPRSFPYTQHVEENNYFLRLPDAPTRSTGDHWFYSSSIVGGEHRNFEFFLHDPDIYSQDWVEIELFGYGESKILQIHDVDLYLNNRHAGTAQWQFTEPVLIKESRFSPSFLKEGKNTLTLVNRSSAGELSKLHFDWCKVTYPRLYSGTSGSLPFAPPGGSAGSVCRFSLEGFQSPDVRVFKKDISRLWNVDVRAVVDTLGTTTYRVQFHDEIVEETARYAAVQEGHFLKPDSAVYVEDEDLSYGGADYLIVLPDDSMHTHLLQNYMEFRQSRGLLVKAVSIETIYNNFSLGMPGPRAIRGLLEAARRDWNPVPRFVLLAGDGHVSEQRHQDRVRTRALLPVPVVQTVKFGAVPSDHWFVVRGSDDPLPDMAIGRWPVRSTRELDAVIQKTLDYEQAPADAWKNRYLLIGARGHGGQDVFRIQSETLIQESMPPSLSPRRLYLGQIDASESATDSLIGMWNQGLALINFRGHGGGAVWSDDRLLTLQDVPSIQNRGRLPVVTSMTCFTADFALYSTSLGESLVLTPETGAAAFWGATGVGWVWNDYYLLEELLDIAAAQPNLTLGEAIMKAKQIYYLTYQGELARSEIYQYTLLGDPALGFAFPGRVMELDCSPRSLTRNDSVELTGQDGTGSRELTLEWALPDRSPHSVEHRSVDNNPWEQTLSLPSDFPALKGGIRVYARDPVSGFQSRGYVDFSLNSAFFSDIGPDPAEPTHRDSLRFRVRAEDAGSIQSVSCVIQAPVNDTLEAEPLANAGWYRTQKALAPVNPGTTISYYFVVKNEQGEQWESDEHTLRIPSLAWLMTREPGLSGKDSVMLECPVRNFGESSVRNLVVRFQVPLAGFTGSDTLMIEGGATERARVPFSASTGTFPVEVILDPDSNLAHVNYSNKQSTYSIETDRFNVTPGQGSLNGQETEAWVGLEGVVLCRLVRGSVAAASVLNTRLLNAGEAASVPQTGYPVMRVQFEDETTELNQPAELKWRRPREDAEARAGIYTWDRSLHRWTRVEGEADDSTFTARTHRLGLFSWMEGDDRRAPLIECYIEDQPLGSMSYVSENPRFQIILQDESGIDIHSPHTRVMLNDQPQAFSAPDSTHDPAQMVIEFQPKLAAGLHRLWVSAADVHGNTGRTEEILFQVSDRFAIQYLGNYPNPFKIQTVFVYVLTDAADRVTLKIYTVAGKLVRVFDDPDMTGADYHEVVWDGTDTWGNQVSNGVYFFSLKARGPRGQKEVTGKIAVMR